MNVFGGITSCVAVAEGIVKALEILGDAATKPLVVRLDGNQVEEGRAILTAANHPLVTLAATMDEAPTRPPSWPTPDPAPETRTRNMSIYLNKDSKVIVQGITGGEGTKHTALMLKAGTNIVGGVNARKAGTTVSHTDKDGNAVELPVFASVAEAIEKTGANVSVAFVPPAFTKDAMIEAIDSEIPLLVVITEAFRSATPPRRGRTRPRRATRPVSSANCPGIITPG